MARTTGRERAGRQRLRVVAPVPYYVSSHWLLSSRRMALPPRSGHPESRVQRQLTWAHVSPSCASLGLVFLGYNWEKSFPGPGPDRRDRNENSAHENGPEGRGSNEAIGYSV